MKFRINEKRKGNTFSFKEILPEVVDDFKIENEFMIEGLKEIWPMVVGDTISSHSVPDRIFKKTLFIAVDHPIYSNELIMMKDMIKKRIEDDFSFYEISNIKFEVKRIKW